MSSDSGGIAKETLIDGRYEIRERLGQGGMGTVYRALDKKIHQNVALKILLNTGGSERSKEERRRRFMHEIYAINAVEHRNVVHIQDFGFHRDTPYMVMELLKGRDLDRVLNESEGLLSIDYCVDVMLAVSAAIEACHDRGVIHRDLKPGNVMIINSEQAHGWDVKVVDFSISKVASELTKDGQILGTPNYLSPEQVAGKVSPASDQYALALLLYVCLTKRHPFENLDGLPLIRAIERGEIKNPRTFRPDIPEELEQVITRAMDVDPDRRFKNMREFGKMIWPWGSQLGQGMWKRYYFETPPGQRPSAQQSTMGIPLPLQMAQGKVPMGGLPTAVVDFQRTTAVQGTTKDGQTANTTLDDPDARAAAEADRAPPSGSGKTLDDPEARPFSASGPNSTSSKWYQDSASLASSSERSEHGRAVRSGAKRIAVIAVGVGLAVAGIVLAGRSMHHPSASEANAAIEARAQLAPEQKPAASAPVVRPAPAPTTAPGEPGPASAAVASSGTAAAAPAPAVASPAHPEHRHSHRKTAKSTDWSTDPSGNPIPPM